MQNPEGVTILPWQLLWLLIFVVCRPGRSQDVLTSCPTEAIACYTDGDCKICADTLQELADSNGFSSITTDCSTFFRDVCIAIDTGECDVDNEYLVDFAQCVAEEEFGCTGFTSCAAAIESPMPTITASMVTSAPTPTALTTAPPSTVAPTITVEVTVQPDTVAPTITAEVTVPPATIHPTPVARDAKRVVPNPAASGTKSMAPTETYLLKSGTESKSSAGTRALSTTMFTTSVALLLGCALLAPTFVE